MLKYYIIVDGSVVTGSLETHGVIEDSNYIDVSESVYRSVELGCTYDSTNNKFIPVTLNVKERLWRDSELERTDTLALLPDYPLATQLLAYRQALRDWTDTEDFPNVRPVMGE